MNTPSYCQDGLWYQCLWSSEEWCNCFRGQNGQQELKHCTQDVFQLCRNLRSFSSWSKFDRTTSLSAEVSVSAPCSDKDICIMQAGLTSQEEGLQIVPSLLPLLCCHTWLLVGATNTANIHSPHRKQMLKRPLTMAVMTSSAVQPTVGLQTRPLNSDPSTLIVTK